MQLPSLFSGFEAPLPKMNQNPYICTANTSHLGAIQQLCGQEKGEGEGVSKKWCLKCNISNSTLAIRSGFDLHRFFHFLSHFGKKQIKNLLARPGFELGFPTGQNFLVLRDKGTDIL